jgi:hypothetical protein
MSLYNYWVANLKKKVNIEGEEAEIHIITLDVFFSL